jgi:hypothetical protein
LFPHAAASLANRAGGFALDLRSPLFQALTGAFKLTIVVGYLLLIRRLPEIRRVFQYHGAEHKTISTYEAAEALVVENARKKSTLHARCGTTFLVMVALVSIVVFTAVAPLLPRFQVGGVVENVLLLVLKLPFLPVIAAVTFELQRIFARYCTTGPLRAVLWPGFLVQKSLDHTERKRGGADAPAGWPRQPHGSARSPPMAPPIERSSISRRCSRPGTAAQNDRGSPAPIEEARAARAGSAVEGLSAHPGLSITRVQQLNKGAPRSEPSSWASTMARGRPQIKEDKEALGDPVCAPCEELRSKRAASLGTASAVPNDEERPGRTSSSG